MKKIFTILTVFALTTTISFAQVQWSAVAGINMANVNYSNESEIDTDMRLGIRLGVTADITLSDDMTLNTGAIYSVKGFSHSFVFADGYTFDQSFSYIEIPLYLTSSSADWLGFTVIVGPYLGILAGTSLYENGEEIYIVNGEFSAMDFGLTLGTSFSFSETISINAVYQKGLAPLQEGGDVYNSNILIGMSYKI